jgi:hypothetical protein
MSNPRLRSVLIAGETGPPRNLSLPSGSDPWPGYELQMIEPALMDVRIFTAITSFGSERN